MLDLQRALAHRLRHPAEDAGDRREQRVLDAGLGGEERAVELDEERLDARRERGELVEGGGAALAHRLRRVGERLDEGGLELRDERLEEDGALLDEQPQRVQDRRLDAPREAVADDADQRAGDRDHARFERLGRREEIASLSRRRRSRSSGDAVSSPKAGRPPAAASAPGEAESRQQQRRVARRARRPPREAVLLGTACSWRSHVTRRAYRPSGSP